MSACRLIELASLNFMKDARYVECFIVLLSPSMI